MEIGISPAPGTLSMMNWPGWWRKECARWSSMKRSVNRWLLSTIL
jgi:hypothetical protein